MDANISITAEDDSEVYAPDIYRVHVSLAGEARTNGDQIGGAEYSCGACHEPLYEDGPGEYLSADTNTAECRESEDGEGPHKPEPIFGAFANSAAVSVSDDEDAVTVTISVGDPRGAFAMTVRRGHDGNLYLSVPTPRDGFPHMNLTEVNDGYYRIS